MLYEYIKGFASLSGEDVTRVLLAPAWRVFERPGIRVVTYT
jgi:hypothetical protein